METVDVKQHWTMLRHWSQFVPNMSTDIRGHEALQHHQQSELSVTNVMLLSTSVDLWRNQLWKWLEDGCRKAVLGDWELFYVSLVRLQTSHLQTRTVIERPQVLTGKTSFNRSQVPMTKVVVCSRQWHWVVSRVRAVLTTYRYGNSFKTALRQQGEMLQDFEI